MVHFNIASGWILGGGAWPIKARFRLWEKKKKKKWRLIFCDSFCNQIKPTEERLALLNWVALFPSSKVFANVYLSYLNSCQRETKALLCVARGCWAAGVCVCARARLRLADRLCSKCKSHVPSRWNKLRLKPISPDSWSMYTRCKHNEAREVNKKAHMQPCTHHFKYPHTHTLGQVLVARTWAINRPHGDRQSRSETQKKEKKKRRKEKQIGSALHFVPGYISVGFPEL